ncbi:hypothetical protein BJX99DRAFT_259032 [Aspergillus californicus]
MDAVSPMSDSQQVPGMAKEFMVGAAGPTLDIVKVRTRVQANQTAIQVARNIWTREGALAFYKEATGSLPPLIGVGVCISIVYATYHTISQTLQFLNLNYDHYYNKDRNGTHLAGGLANSFISGPTEHIRIRLQTQFLSFSISNSHSHSKPYTGVLSCIRHIHPFWRKWSLPRPNTNHAPRIPQLRDLVFRVRVSHLEGPSLGINTTPNPESK